MTAEIKTPSKKTEVVQSKDKNILDKYRSYSYSFTLAGIRRDDLKHPDRYRNRDLDLVVLKSGGKGTTGLTASANSLKTNLVSGFNKDSAGRFDMFIDDIEMKNISSFRNESNVSFATTLRFIIGEPYSINGFLETLNVVSQEAGYPNYVSASYILRLEFWGYPDDADLPTAERVPMSTRDFVFKFSKVSVELTERGTRYICEAIPFNETTFGNPNILTRSVSVNGNKVKDLLEDLMKNITEQLAEESKQSRSGNDANKHDKYEIRFPTINEDGSLDYTSTNKIGESKIDEVISSSGPSGMEDSSVTEKKNKYSADPNQSSAETARLERQQSSALGASRGSVNPQTITNAPVVLQRQFWENSRIHDIISSVIRDSHYTKDLLKKIHEGQGIDKDGFVDYFTIYADTVNSDEIDRISKKPYQTFVYTVIPYKVYHTRIPGFESKKVDQETIEKISSREYNYIYSGNNTDLINFKLNFDNLYFEGMVTSLGNNDQPGTKTSAAATNSVDVKYSGSGRGSSEFSATDLSRSDIGDQMDLIQKKSNQQLNSIFPSGTVNSSTDINDPFSILVKNMHNAIVESKTSLLSGQVEIIGDPFYLTSGGAIGLLPTYDAAGKTKDGSIDQHLKEILITINFRNPIDIDPLEKGGRMYFGDRVPFSGVFRVTEIVSTFSKGVFKQRLEVLRMPGQFLKDKQKPENTRDFYDTIPDPINQTVEPSTFASNTGLRPSSGNLLLQLGRGLPSPGLPGILSNFTRSDGGLSGTANQLLNQVSGAVTAGVGRLTSATLSFGNIPGGLDQLASGIRLNASGLTNLAQVGLGSAALLDQAAKSAEGALAKVNVATQIATDITARANQLKDAAMVAGSGIGKGASILLKDVNQIPEGISQISDNLNKNLESIKAIGTDASKIVSSVGDKLAQLQLSLPSDPTALASKFGIDPVQLSGLSSNLQSKVLDQVSNLAKQIPESTDLNIAVSKGLILDYIPGDKLKNLPATAPNSVAPLLEIDKKFFDSIMKSGNLQTLANVFGVNDVSKISQSLLESADATKLLGSQLIKNPLANLQNQINQTDITSLGGKILSVEKQLSSITGSVKSLEASLNNVKTSFGTSLATGSNLEKSVANVFGSKSQGTSPLDRLMSG